MCQICTRINDIAGRSTWPKPLRAPVKELLELLPPIHVEITTLLSQQFTSQRKNTGSANVRDGANATATEAGRSQTTGTTITITKINTSAPGAQTSEIAQSTKSVLQSIQILYMHIDLLGSAREEWWDSSAKKKQRRELLDACHTNKLTELQVINNKTASMIADMEVPLGTFVRWNLGVDDGLDGLDAAMARFQV